MASRTTPNKHDAIVAELRARIESGALRPGDRMPTFVEVRAHYGVAVQTVDRVYGTLERLGLIVRRSGSGTFVAEHHKTDEAGRESGAAPLLGLLVPAVEQVFFAGMVSGAEEQCRELGAHLIVGNTRGSLHIEAQQIASLAPRVAGMAMVPSHGAVYASYQPLIEHQVPFVFLDRTLDKFNVSLVAFDNETAGYLATKHLIEQGHRRVFLLRAFAMSSVDEREAGYRRALEEAGIAVRSEWICRDHHGPTDQDVCGFYETRRLLQLYPGEKLALFCINDPIARGAYAALKEAGKRIPDDCALIAVGDSNAALMEPPLSAIEFDLPEIGARAIELLWEAIKRGADAPIRQVALQPTLTVRHSTAPDLHSRDLTRLISRSDELLAAHPAATDLPAPSNRGVLAR